MQKGNIVAILRSLKEKDVVSIVETLLKYGISSVEVSLSEEETGLSCITSLANAFPKELHLGVGTVVTKEQVDRSLDAGASYIITPGWDRELVRYAKTKQAVVFPGVFSPGEILQAVQEKIEIMKLFPTVTLGVDYIKQLKGPFPNLHIMGVGGISKENILEYFEAGCSSFGIGSDLVPRAATKADLSSIQEKAAVFASLQQIMKG